MSKLFYAKLALVNLRKNSKTYIPFILTCIGTVIMFYNICSLSFSPATDGNTQQIMYLGTGITAIFVSIFLFYTNSFLIKRRKKEFGLFNILGMEKKHIGIMMLWETIFVFTFSMIIGLALGIVFSKIITLSLFKILQFEVSYGFEISFKAIAYTLILFTGIFVLTLLNNLKHVHTSKPIELLQGGNKGEKEPKTKWFTTTVGVITLGAGYAIALSVKNPLSAIGYFFIAAILVIIGTYCLFTSGSIAFLKMVKKNKKYYYKTNHFTSISGMIYRMKQNAVGLANICIMSTAVLIMISTTVAMFIGVNDIIENKFFPKDFVITAGYEAEKDIDKDHIENVIIQQCEEAGIKIENYGTLSSLAYNCKRNGNEFSCRMNDALTATDSARVVFITAEQYTKITGIDLSLEENEVLAYNSKNELSGTINIFGEEYSATDILKTAPVDIGNDDSWCTDFNCIVFANSDKIEDVFKVIKQNETGYHALIAFDVSFDVVDATEDEQIKLSENISKQLSINQPYNTSYFVDSKAEATPQIYAIYGGLFFLGIFLGILFLMATVLIIYYKQIVEGFEDKERFNIMQKVGMSRSEIKSSISSQVLTVFALPILAAVIHIIVAFPILKKLLAVLNLTNVPLFIICTLITVVIFIIIYAIVYALTAKTYYKIVNNS